MTTVIEYLESFNRKERFFLVGAALGNKQFQLGAAFRERVGAEFGPDIPEDAFVAMDYHLDWIQASVYLPREGSSGAQVYSNAAGLIMGNQEDVDLIVAFVASGTTHLIMLEAKAYGSWDNKQMSSKADRLYRIFGSDGDAVLEVVPHYGLISPRRPERLETDRWPRWMLSPSGTPAWLELSLPPGRRRLTRCDAAGNPAQDGGYFKVRGPGRLQNAPIILDTKEAREPKIRNFDGLLALDDVLAHCHLHPEIEVGHLGGEDDLVEKGVIYAEGKRWKWRDPNTNRGKALRMNWIAGTRFIDLIAGMRA